VADELTLGPATRQIRDQVRELPERLGASLAEAWSSSEGPFSTSEALAAAGPLRDIVAEVAKLVTILAGHIDAVRVQFGGDANDDVRIEFEDEPPQLRIV
jgi:hypothetical protein